MELELNSLPADRRIAQPQTRIQSAIPSSQPGLRPSNSAGHGWIWLDSVGFTLIDAAHLTDPKRLQFPIRLLSHHPSNSTGIGLIWSDSVGFTWIGPMSLPLLIAEIPRVFVVVAVFDMKPPHFYADALVGSMLTVSPITRQTVGKTFTLAISILGVGAVLQLGAVCWAFATRLRTQSLSLAGSGEEGTTPTAKVAPEKGLDLTDLPGDTAAGATGTTPIVAPRPTPAPLSAQKTEDSPPANRFEEQIAQGKTLRERGDTSTALVRFREAAATDPQSPIPIAEIAATYEKMGLDEKAGEQWRLIYDMGEAAGIYFSLAEAKLKVAMKVAVDKNAPPVAPAPEVEGIASGMTLGLLPITNEDKNDEVSAKRFTLHIPIKARPNSKIDPHELVIQVLFFDILNGQNVVQTAANVSSRWLTAPADWVDSDTEELAVEYQLPRPEPRTRENRKFFGYIVRIYYKKELQAASADPERLGQQYAAPPTLPKEPEK
jgi:hypothetical protein